MVREKSVKKKNFKVSEKSVNLKKTSVHDKNSAENQYNIYLFILIMAMANFFVFELSSMSQIVYDIILCICFLSTLLHELHVLTLRIGCMC